MSRVLLPLSYGADGASYAVERGRSGRERYFMRVLRIPGHFARRRSSRRSVSCLSI